MQESGISEIIPLIYTLTIWYPAFFSILNPIRVHSWEWLQLAEGLAGVSLSPSQVPLGLTIEHAFSGLTVATSFVYLTAGNIFHSHHPPLQIDREGDLILTQEF